MEKLRALPALKVIQKFSKRKGERGNWESLWQDLTDFISPRKDAVTGSVVPGEKKYVDLFDSTGMNSAELLAGALHGMLTNPSGFFFGLSTGDPLLDMNDRVRKYCQDVERIMHNELNKSNFQTEAHEMYLDLVCLGTSPVSMEEDENPQANAVVRFMARPLREVCIEENYKGVVDTMFRSYCCDARGLVEEFGIDSLPEKVMKAFKEQKDDKFEVLHAIYPTSQLEDGERKKYKGYGWVSQYILVSDKINLHIGRFREFPYIVPRWSKITGESYGRGPGEKALAECKVVNKMTEITLSGAQKTIDPPLQAPDDGFVLPLYTTPAGLNFYRAGSQDRIEPIFNDARIDFGFQSIQMKQAQIREAFYVDQLKLREGPMMTATEVMERTEQALRFLGPMLGRMQQEFLAPLIQRLWHIMERRGLLPTAPDELTNIELKIQYTSVVAMSQRLSELQNIQRTFQNLQPLAAIDPTCMDVIDATALAKHIAKLCNFPQEAIRDKQGIVDFRDARAKMQQQQMQMQQQSQEVDNAAKMVSATAKMQKKAG
jgi:hypothetical protein